MAYFLSKAHAIVHLLDLAAPVVKHFWTDLRHDAKLIADAQEGTVIFWAPREGGSYLLVLRRAQGVNREAEALAIGMTSQQPRLQWWNLAFDGTDSVDIRPIATDDMLASCRSISELARNPLTPVIREIHL